MKVAGIVQARMGSTRLPGKVLKDLGGATLLGRVVSRLRRSALTDCLMVATSIRPGDDAIVEECRRLAVDVVRGSELDVLDRYYRAAQQAQADAVVRITADCPFVDAELVDELLQCFFHHHPDYASTSLVRSYPRGLDAEVMTFAALSDAWREARQPYQRTHVTPYLYENPLRFRLFSLAAEDDSTALRWTVDTEEDLTLARAVYRHFDNRDDFGWRDVLQLMTAQPQLAQINQHVRQKALEQG